jgi:hypothetical protein
MNKETGKSTDLVKRFEVSLQTRNLEIDLFWKRSLFFWGFISAAFIAYAALRQSELRIVVACFGMVCSCAWTLVNRGSKYWQENWETKVEHNETPIVGALFSKEEKRQPHKGWWLSGRQYSVSKLAIALSDYISVLWVAVVTSEVMRLVVPSYLHDSLRQWSIESFIAFSGIYVVLMLIYGRKTPRTTGDKS